MFVVRRERIAGSAKGVRSTSRGERDQRVLNLFLGQALRRSATQQNPDPGSAGGPRGDERRRTDTSCCRRLVVLGRATGRRGQSNCDNTVRCYPCYRLARCFWLTRRNRRLGE
jgi:hypothetical protein